MGAMSLGSRVCVVVCALALALGLGAPVRAATSTVLTLTAPAAYADDATTLTVAVTDENGSPLAGAQLLLERRNGEVWQGVGTVTTGGDGRASVDLTVSRVAADNAVRATYAGDAEHPAAVQEGTLPIAPRAGRVSLAGPKAVVDERSVTLRVLWRTGNGRPLAGDVRIFRQAPGGRWTACASTPASIRPSGSVRSVQTAFIAAPHA